MKNRIGAAFERTRQEGRKAFIAYLTAGDPGLAETARYVRLLEKSGVDVMELGVPHSDPVADGPTNIRSAARALGSGTSLKKILALVASLRSEGCELPIILFTYLNPILKMGFASFAEEAKKVGVDGVLVVDLPMEEAEEYVKALRAQQLDTIFLAAPTTPVERFVKIEELSSGFLYYVSRTGVTGAQQSLSSTLERELKALKTKVTLPICVGFGISTPEQVREVARQADGVVVGSALVKVLEEIAAGRASDRNLGELATQLAGALRN